VQSIRRRVIAKALWLVQTRNDLHDLVGIEIDNRHRVVFELGYKQAIAREIDRQMVDAAANFAPRDFPFEQGKGFIRPNRRDGEGARNHKRRRQPLHRIVSSFSLISTSVFRGYREAVESCDLVGLGPKADAAADEPAIAVIDEWPAV